MEESKNVKQNKKEVNFIMMNMHNNKGRKIFAAIIIVVLVLAMVVPVVLSAVV